MLLDFFYFFFLQKQTLAKTCSFEITFFPAVIIASFLKYNIIYLSYLSKLFLSNVERQFERVDIISRQTLFCTELITVYIISIHTIPVWCELTVFPLNFNLDKSVLGFDHRQKPCLPGE